VTATNQDVQLNVPSQAGQAASILYENVPVQGDWYFNAGVYHIALGTGGGATTYSVEYSQSKNTYTYLYDPQAGLYKFYLPVSLSDVVDLSISPMDTAVSSVFVVPPGDHLTYFELDGVMDTTDVSTALWLAYFLNPGLNFGYPPKYVQKYGMKVQGASADGTEGFIYYNYSDSVPSTMPFQNSSSYTLNATKNNNFSVTFNGIKPSYYATAWNTGSIGYYVWENPDSTTLMALPLLTSLHSRMLAGQDLSGLALTNFNYEMALGYYYFGWLNYACDPSQIQTYHMGYESEYFKTL
jgi:hypothetical protein